MQKWKIPPLRTWRNQRFSILKGHPPNRWCIAGPVDNNNDYEDEDEDNNNNTYSNDDDYDGDDDDDGDDNDDNDDDDDDVDDDDDDDDDTMVILIMILKGTINNYIKSICVFNIFDPLVFIYVLEWLIAHSRELFLTSCSWIILICILFSRHGHDY